jgi:hypothetical protein
VVALAEDLGVEYLGVIRSTPTHTRIVCTAGPLAETYVKGAKGIKSVNEGCHEAYCERVHDTGEELHIPDADQDEEWVGAEEFRAFGLRSYYGSPSGTTARPSRPSVRSTTRSTTSRRAIPAPSSGSASSATTSKPTSRPTSTEASDGSPTADGVSAFPPR